MAKPLRTPYQKLSWEPKLKFFHREYSYPPYVVPYLSPIKFYPTYRPLKYFWKNEQLGI